MFVFTVFLLYLHVLCEESILASKLAIKNIFRKTDHFYSYDS